MNLKYYYWCFPKAITVKVCDDIIKYANEKKTQKGVIGSLDKDNLNEEQKKHLKSIRDSDIVWLNDKWIYRHIQPFVRTANKEADWNFEWDWSEEMQFTKYNNGQYYDWHMDSNDGPYNKPEFLGIHGKIRKLSVTVQLTNPDEYEGGELEFQPRMNRDPLETYIEERSFEKGTIIVFPSHIYHRVRPVTKGTRYSLVMWNLGHPFK